MEFCYTNEGRIISKIEHDKYWKNISIFHHHYNKDAFSVKHNYLDLFQITFFFVWHLSEIPVIPQILICTSYFIFCRVIIIMAFKRNKKPLNH